MFDHPYQHPAAQMSGEVRPRTGPVPIRALREMLYYLHGTGGLKNFARRHGDDGSTGNRTRVLGFEAQEDILYPIDPGDGSQR